MWRPTFTIFRKLILPSLKEKGDLSRIWYSTKSRLPNSATKLTLVSASVGVLVGAGYGGYTHYKINVKKSQHESSKSTEYPFLEKAPEYKAHYKVINDSDNSNLQLVLFQYRTCPFCCKVRSYLDYQGISYEVVEVDAVLRQAIKWSPYKKVPILLAKVDGGYQQLLDSTAIISVLETYLSDKAHKLTEILSFYPPSNYVNDDGKDTTDIPNKYFIMHNATLDNEAERKMEMEVREWRQWADKVLVHLLSPNVYRSPGEALETFRWFQEVGGWRENFPGWECAVMVYGGALAMWLVAKKLKKRHNLDDDVRSSLYKAADDWCKAIERKGTRFMGGERPNLADVSVFGVLSSIEGCQAFRDLRDHTKLGEWFDETKKFMDTRRGTATSLATA